MSKWQFFGISFIPFVTAIIVHLLFKFTLSKKNKKPEYLEPNKCKWFYKHIKYPIQKFFYSIASNEKRCYWWKQIWAGLIFMSVAVVGRSLAIIINIPSDVATIVPSGSFAVGNSTVAPIVAGLCFGWPAGIISGGLASIIRYAMDPNGFLTGVTAISLVFSGLVAAAVSRFIFVDKRPRWYFGLLTGFFVETFNILLIYFFNLNRVGETFELVRKFDFVCIGFSGFSNMISLIALDLIDRKRIIPRKKDLNNISFHVQLALFLACSLGLIIMTTSSRAFSALKNEEDYSILCEKTLQDVQHEIKTATDEYIPKDNQTVLVSTLIDEATKRHMTTEGRIITVAASELIYYNEEGEKLIFFNDRVVGSPSEFNLTPREDEFTFSIGGKRFKLSDKLSDVDKTIFVTFNKRVYLMRFNSFSVDGNIYAYVVALIPYSEIESTPETVFRICLYTNLLVIITLFSFAQYFVNRKIVSRVETIDQALEQIMYGDLDKELHVGGYNEFSNLSNNINLTVGALKNYAQEIETRINNELQFARDIQTGSVPTAFPFEKNYNIYARMEPAREVGGDFYDYYKMNNGRILIAIADVSGKGIPAAMFMMRARTLIKSLAATDIPLDIIVNTANKDLCTQNEAALFVTAWIGILDPNNGELRYINCGHPNPLIKKANGKFEEFKNKHNFVLASMPDFNFKSDIIYLNPGDELVLYTDGVTEAHNPRNELYGVNRLIDFANSAKYFNAKQLLDEITDDVVRYAEGMEQFDDTTLLIMRYLGNNDIVPETAITLKARPSNASIAVNFVESILAKYELPASFIAQVSIVVDELFANIAFYAYPEGHIGEATIQVDFREESLFLTLIDSGKPFDPTVPREVDTSSAIEDRKRGGLGIFLVKRTMDELKYEYKDNKNILNLMKRLKNIKPDKKPDDNPN